MGERWSDAGGDNNKEGLNTGGWEWPVFSWQVRSPSSLGDSADIFQAEMMDLMEALEYVRAYYIDDQLVITRGTLEDPLDKLREILRRLLDAGLKVNKNSCNKSAQHCQEMKTFPRNGTILPWHVGEA